MAKSISKFIKFFFTVLFGIVFFFFGGYIVYHLTRKPRQRRKGRDDEPEGKMSRIKSKIRDVVDGSVEQGTRQRAIMTLLDENKSLKMGDLMSKFPDVTARTLRRDMTKLERSGLVKKKGKTRSSVYVKA